MNVAFFVTISKDFTTKKKSSEQTKTAARIEITMVVVGFDD